MIKIRRSTPITACKKLDGNDIYPLINFSWIMVAFAFLFVFLLSEVSADPMMYRSKYTLSLKGVHFSTEKSEPFEDWHDTRSRRSTSASDTEGEMPNLREAYEKFDDYHQTWDKKENLVCAKIFNCLKPLLESSNEKLPINPQKGRGGKSSKFTSESEEYYSLLRDQRFQSEISAVIELAKEGKSQENDKQAFSNNEQRQSKRVTKTTRELLEKYESLRQSMRQKYPRIVRNRLLSVEDF